MKLTIQTWPKMPSENIIKLRGNKSCNSKVAQLSNPNIWNGKVQQIGWGYNDISVNHLCCLVSWSDLQGYKLARPCNLPHHRAVLGLFPARISEISSPRLKAWLNIRRVWNVDTNGNHERNAMGIKTSIPIPASYSRAIERMDFQSPSLFIKGFQAAAIWNSEVLCQAGWTYKFYKATGKYVIF